MQQLTMTRKEEILRRSQEYYRQEICDPKIYHYFVEFDLCSENFLPSPGEIEPLVDVTDLWAIDSKQSWLTVNKYNCLILNSHNLFIADIDFSPGCHKACEDMKDVLHLLQNLSALDQMMSSFNDKMDGESPLFAEQSFNVYQTLRGCRVICTTAEFPWNDVCARYHAESLLGFLRSDPHYITLCKWQMTYRARLTPKPWRCKEGVENYVCDLVEVTGGHCSLSEGTTSSSLQEQIALHDEFTLASSCDEQSELCMA